MLIRFLSMFRTQKPQREGYWMSYHGRGEIRAHKDESHISFEGERLVSLGYVLYPPRKDLHWSGVRAGEVLTIEELEAIKQAFLDEPQLNNEWYEYL